MDFEKEKSAEEQEAEAFQKIANSQAKVAKKLVLTIFSIIGTVFLIIGIFLILFDVRDEESGLLIGIVFAPIGVFYALLGLVIYKLIPDNKVYNYQKIKENSQKFGFAGNSYSYSIMLAKIDTLEKKVSKLEEELNNLKDKQYK